jgi:hypothetical protein
VPDSELASPDLADENPVLRYPSGIPIRYAQSCYNGLETDRQFQCQGRGEATRFLELSFLAPRR